MKYFLNEQAKTIECVTNEKLIEQYEKHTDRYVPCDKSGKPLKAEKPETDAEAKAKTAAAKNARNGARVKSEAEANEVDADKNAGSDDQPAEDK